MKNFTILTPFSFKKSTILTCILTLFLSLWALGAYSQPCDDCNDCNGNPTPASNPDVQNPCLGFDIVLVLDESWSISQINGGATAVKNAVLSFLGSVNCGNLKVRVMQFRTEAFWVTNNYQSFPDALNSMETHFDNNGYNPAGQTGYTNWHSALAGIRAMGDRPELVLFWTDGLPTAMNGEFTGNGNEETCNSNAGDNGPNRNAVYEANILRNSGTHMFVVGIGSVGNTGEDNLQDISGTNEYNSSSESVLTADYSLTSFTEVAEDMQNLAFSLCPSVTCESLNICPMAPQSGSIEVTANVGGNSFDWIFSGPEGTYSFR